MKTLLTKRAFLLFLFLVGLPSGSELYKDMAYGQAQNACYSEIVLASKNLRYALSDLASLSYIFEQTGQTLVVTELAARQVGVVEYKTERTCDVDEVIAMRESVRDSLDKVRKAFRASTTLSGEPEAFAAFRAMVARWESYRDLVSDLQDDAPLPTPDPTPSPTPRPTPRPTPYPTPYPPIDSCSYLQSRTSCLNSSSCDWSYSKNECFTAKGKSCSYYSQYGANACGAQPNCDWSYSKNECFIASGQYCSYYSQYGANACSAQSNCDWSYSKNECFIASGQSCSYYTEYGSYACSAQSNCDWSYSKNECYIASGRACSYYTEYGSYACSAQSSCDWNYSRNICEYK